MSQARGGRSGAGAGREAGYRPSGAVGRRACWRRRATYPARDIVRVESS